MTRATLTIYTNEGDPIVAEFDVQTAEDEAQIIITDTEVKIHTSKQPTIVSPE